MSEQKIFISYSHANEDIVHEVANRLKQVYNVWIDRDYLIGGKPQAQEISNGINNATLFIPFISDEYCNSDACREEFALAKNKKKICYQLCSSEMVQMELIYK